MGKTDRGVSSPISQPDSLFINLAEQVKLPFLQIAHASELMSESSDKVPMEQLRRDIRMTSQAALKLIDGYLLSVELQSSSQLELESVSVSSIMFDAATSLRDYALAHDCDLELNVDGKFGPVLGHRQALLAGFVSLGYSFIESAVKPDNGAKARVDLSLRRTASGISAGVYVSNDRLSKSLLARAKDFGALNHQPLTAFDSGNGTGVFVADALFQSIGAPLKLARAHGLMGLAATLIPSRQLSLV